MLEGKQTACLPTILVDNAIVFYLVITHLMGV